MTREVLLPWFDTLLRAVFVFVIYVLAVTAGYGVAISVSLERHPTHEQHLRDAFENPIAVKKKVARCVVVAIVAALILVFVLR